jgi:hypothetical protein
MEFVVAEIGPLMENAVSKADSAIRERIQMER